MAVAPSQPTADESERADSGRDLLHPVRRPRREQLPQSPAGHPPRVTARDAARAAERAARAREDAPREARRLSAVRPADAEPRADATAGGDRLRSARHPSAPL